MKNTLLYGIIKSFTPAIKERIVSEVANLQYIFKTSSQT